MFRKKEFATVSSFGFINRTNVMLSWVEHEKSFMTSGVVFAGGDSVYSQVFYMYSSTTKTDQTAMKHWLLQVFIGLISAYTFSHVKPHMHKFQPFNTTTLPLVLLNPDIPCLCRQCRSRSVGFWEANWSGSKLFAIQYVNISTIWIK